MENKEYRILIAGDLFPAPSNVKLFEQGDAKQLYGEKVLGIFARADYSIANIEGVFTDSPAIQEKVGPIIKSSKASVNGIKQLGLSAAALANNHVTDANQEGCMDTISCLQANGISIVGIGTEKDMKDHLSVAVGPYQVCIYNVSDLFYNAPTCTEYGVNLYDEYVVCNRLKELKEIHDYVFVIYHGGAEYFQYATPLVYKRCHRMADSGADVIVTQHTHTIGCEEQYNGTYILHGQGNFFFARQKRRPDLTKEGLLLEIVLCDKGLQTVKHRVDIVNNSLVRYSNNQDFTEFYQRTIENEDRKNVEEAFREEKVHEIAVKYLLAMKGKSFYWRLMRRMLPSTIFKELLFKSYTPKQLLLILDALVATRRNESMQQVIKHLQIMNINELN